MEYEPVIGMEVHAELSTDSKVFCGCSTKFGAPPNSQVCPVCLGMPGVLPVLNKKAVEYTIRTALAMNCEIASVVSFDRKNYYYPDLPKNYQISQNNKFFGTNGYLEIGFNGKKKRIQINNVHLEEDAGKNLHPEHPGADYSLVDLNRAGLPLIEIVSEPDMNSIAEADAYMNTLKNLLQYIEVSDCKMQEGSLRFEVNISVRPVGEKKLGTKVEIKNLASMRIALKCIEYEFKRQVEAIESREKIFQETRLWDEESSVTRTMRSKEFAQDYRYFPEPDLVEVNISNEWKEQIRKSLPELQDAKQERFIRDYEIPEYDAEILTSSKFLADYYENAVKLCNNPKTISNWIMTELLRELKEREIEANDFIVTPKHIAELVRLIDDGTISGKIAKQIFSETVLSGKLPSEIVKEKGLVQITDISAIEKIVDEVLKENPEAITAIKAGKDRTIGFLVGEIMKRTKGKANPKIVNDLIRKKMLG